MRTYLEVLKPLFPTDSLNTILQKAGIHIWSSELASSKLADVILASWMTVVKEYVNHRTSPYGSVPLSPDLLPAGPGETFTNIDAENALDEDWLECLLKITEEFGLKNVTPESLAALWETFAHRLHDHLNSTIFDSKEYKLFVHEGRIYGARFYEDVLILYWRTANEAST